MKFRLYRVCNGFTDKKYINIINLLYEERTYDYVDRRKKLFGKILHVVMIKTKQ